MDSATLALIEPERLMREGLKVLFQGSPFSVVYEADCIRTAADAIRSGPPVDLILTHVSTHGEDACSDLAYLRDGAGNAKIVALAPSIDRAILRKVSKLGVSGLLLKNISPQALIRSLHLALVGDGIFAIHGMVFDEPDEFLPQTVEDQLLTQSLSSRERHILRCLTVGHSNKEIARELDLTEATIKAHLKVVMRKIKANNRTQAAIWGLANQGSLGI